MQGVEERQEGTAHSRIDLLSDAITAQSSNAPVITNCIVSDSNLGLLATAYTYSGDASTADPVVTNTIFAAGIEGAVFETTAYASLPTGSRRNASSNAVLTHCTITQNVGSGLILDDTNLGQG